MVAREEREARARARGAWPGALRTLETMADELVVNAPPGELMGLVTELTLAAWAMRGEPIPTYERSEAEGRVIRSGRP